MRVHLTCLFGFVYLLPAGADPTGKDKTSLRDSSIGNRRHVEATVFSSSRIAEDDPPLQGFNIVDFDPKKYYTIKDIDKDKFWYATEDPLLERGRFDKKIDKQSSGGDTKTDARAHWRFELGSAADQYVVINRGTGRKVHIDDEKWLTTDVKQQNNGGIREVYIECFGESQRKHYIRPQRANSGGSGRGKLKYGSTGHYKADFDKSWRNSGTLEFEISEVTSYTPADMDNDIKEVSVSKPIDDMTLELVQLGLSLVGYGSTPLGLGTTILNYALGQAFGDSGDLSKQLEDLSSQILEIADEIVTDTVANDNVKNGNDGLKVARDRYLKTYDSYKTEALQAGDTTEVTDTMNYLSRNVINDHQYSIAVFLIDSDYDATDDVTLKTAQIGWSLLKYAAIEGINMVSEYVSLAAFYSAKMGDSETCTDILADAKLETQYENYFGYLNDTYNMLYDYRKSLLEDEVIKDKETEYLRKTESTAYCGWKCTVKDEAFSDRQVYKAQDEYETEKWDTTCNFWDKGDGPSGCQNNNAKQLYEAEVLWDMENFSYEWAEEKDRFSDIDDELETLCKDVKADPDSIVPTTIISSA